MREEDIDLAEQDGLELARCAVVEALADDSTLGAVSGAVDDVEEVIGCGRDAGYAVGFGFEDAFVAVDFWWFVSDCRKRLGGGGLEIPWIAVVELKMSLFGPWRMTLPRVN